MFKRFWSTLALLAVSSLILAACASGAKQPGPGAQGGGGQAIAGDVNKGKQIFDQTCSSCHSTGTDLKVGPGLKGITSRNIKATNKPANEANLKEWIKTGGGQGMPGGLVPEADLPDVIAYLKTL